MPVSYGPLHPECIPRLLLSPAGQDGQLGHSGVMAGVKQALPGLCCAAFGFLYSK